MNYAKPEPHWLPDVLKIIDAFVLDSAEEQQDAIEEIRVTYGHDPSAAEFAAEAFAKRRAERETEAEAPQGRIQLPAVVAQPQSKPLTKTDAAIEALNANHAVIDNVGGKTVIASWEPSPLDPARLIIVFQTKESFLLRYSNRYAYIDSPDGRGGNRSQ